MAKVQVKVTQLFYMDPEVFTRTQLIQRCIKEKHYLYKVTIILLSYVIFIFTIVSKVTVIMEIICSQLFASR